MTDISAAEDHDFLYVCDTDTLRRFEDEALPAIEGATIALDIEEDRELRYDPSVALIQITVGTSDYVLDPVVLGAEALAAAVEAVCLTAEAIVMHGSRNDVIGLKRDFGVGPVTLLDTQVAARFARHSSFGLAPLLDEHFGVTLDKAVRRSRWIERPLSEQQLQYARDDTRYLLYLWDVLAELADDAGWMDAVEEECAAINALAPEPTSFDDDGWRRVKGARGLDEPGKRRLAALWTWRDDAAKRHDFHPSRVMAPWALMHLAENGVRAFRNGRSVHGLAASIEAEERANVEDALENPPPVPPQERGSRRRSSTPRISRDVVEARVEKLAGWRASASKATGLEPGFLAPKSVLEAIARTATADEDAFAAHEEIRRWRACRFADAWNACCRD